MKSKRILTTAALALMSVMMSVILIATAGCKMSGMAVTSRGQLLKLNINHPKDLPERGEDNIDIVVGSRGVNGVRDILLDVEIPPQLIVEDETHERGVTMTHDPGSNVYHYTLGNLQPAEDSTIRYKVRTSFGTMAESDTVKATAWQRDLPGDKLVETAVIKLRP
ncbi:MAG: hypothetical protein JO093_02105 [Acidobacteria bacterium]|nr:hypothetical protein [Acidobacteriota bacterium]MBV9069782.1 hypothetical protein [Acidobacteriota bacterium]MBV9184377.1 hypothetical protein [Acidobacteriota bacterium]